MKTLRPLLLALVAVFALAATTRAANETYKIDSAHSSVGFTIRHFLTKIPGNFAQFEGAIVVDRAHLKNSQVEAVITVTSVNTSEPKRDAHLQSADFFLSAQFPKIVFKSKSWKATGENTFAVTGDLTIKDTTKEVVLQVTLLGFGPGMSGKAISGWEATTKLDRRDFGLTYGQGIVGNDVDVTINIEAGLQP